MKLKEGFLLREVAGRIVVVPEGDVLNLNLMISLNGTGRFLWERLDKGASVQELEDALMEQYNVDQQRASADVQAFIEMLNRHGFLE
jgi:hypothetical protein